MKEIYKLKPKKYQLLIYEADKSEITEPITYAWEITDPDSDRPYRIWNASRVDYEDISEALKDGIEALFAMEM